MTHHNRLPSQCVGFKTRQEGNGICDVGCGGELTVNRFIQKHFLDDVFFAHVEDSSLLRDLLIDQGRTNKSWAHDIGANAARAAFFGDCTRQAQQTMFGRDVG